MGAAAESSSLPGADPERGASAIARYGCGGCHVIPGVPGAQGLVGPPLAGVAKRAMIAGRLHTDGPNLVSWIQHPQEIAPGVDMPDLGVTDADARDIAAYLLTLK
jgi:cytochrome c2